jgi:hypothetical protein
MRNGAFVLEKCQSLSAAEATEERVDECQRDKELRSMMPKLFW